MQRAANRLKKHKLADADHKGALFLTSGYENPMGNKSYRPRVGGS